MVLKIHGNAQASCTKRVLTVCEELGLPYELIPIDFQNWAHKSPVYLALQPFGQMPVIDDDGFILFESRAIGRYLARQYAHARATWLIPDPGDVQKTALFEQAASIELTNFDPSAYGLAVENIFKPYYGEKPDEAAVARHKATLESKLAAYDVILGKTKYLAGDEITLADLFHLSYGSLLEVQGIDLLYSGKFPNVTRWWKDVSGRPSWKKVQPLTS